MSNVSVRLGLARSALAISCAAFCTVGCVPKHASVIPEFPEKLVVPKTPGLEERSVVAPKEGAPRIRFQATPVPPEQPILASRVPAESRTQFSGPKLAVNLDSLPLPAFINEVYGNLLKQSFEIAPELQEKTDLVTLRIAEAQEPAEVYRLANRVLNNYGVAAEQQGEVLRFFVGRSTQESEAPLLVSGLALPNVPVSHRPVFQFIPMKVVQAADAATWLKQAFDGQKLEVSTDAAKNAIWLRGPVDQVRQGGEVLSRLDQPVMRGRSSVRIDPLYIPAERLAARLAEVLAAEGYNAVVRGNGSIVLLPIQETNTLIVYAGDKSILDHVKSWVEELDQPVIQADSKGVFLYSLRNIPAVRVASTLNGMLSGQETGGASPLASPAGGTPVTQGQPPTASRSARASGQRLVVDEGRNAILFQGSSDEWNQLLTIIRRMDTPARQVLVEVIVAEVTLNDEYKFGIDWAINSAALGERLFTFDKTDKTPDGKLINDVSNGFSIGSSGLSFYPMSSSGQTRAILNAFAQNGEVSILQTPRIMVRSGEQAQINVGTDIPVTTSQANVPGLQQGGTPALVNQVEYRRTGVSLNVQPVVYEGGRVDLTINQEISSQAKTQANATGNPLILNRSLQTVLSVNDGGSVLLGGLMTDDGSQGETKVPLLGDIPVLGQLFTSRTQSKSRTELMMLIVPYVIDNGEEAEAITEAYRSRLDLRAPTSPNGQKTSE